MMITASCMGIALGFWCLYNTSKRALLPMALAGEHWLRRNKTAGKIFGTVFVAAGFIASMAAFGTASGIFYGLVVLMTWASLVITVAPLKMVGRLPVAAFFLLLLIIELI